MSKDCRCKEVECEECPEWIFTLADLIMCMMGLFVILWVLKPAPDKKLENNEDWIKVAAAIREAFKYLPDPDSKDPVDQAMLLKKLELLDPMKGKGMGAETQTKRKSPVGTEEESSTIRPGKISVVGGKMNFDPGAVKISPPMAHTLDQMADLVRGHRNIVLIRGHTSFDDLGEEATPQQRMDLSIKRAQTVADYLVSKNVEPDIVRVMGCSTFEPVSRGEYTPEAQAQNRRVEIEATSNLVEDRQEKSREVKDPADAIPGAPAPEKKAEPPHGTLPAANAAGEH